MLFFTVQCNDDFIILKALYETKIIESRLHDHVLLTAEWIWKPDTS